MIQHGNEEKEGKRPSCTEVSVSEEGNEVEREADKLTGTSSRVHKAGLATCISDRENICFDSSTGPAPAGSLTLQELPDEQDCKVGFGITSMKEVYACESG